MKASELRGLSNDDLTEKLGKLRREIFDTRFNSSTETVTNGAQLNTKRKDIARILSILNARERGAESLPGKA